MATTQVPGPIENLFFDLDGTLVDSLPGIDYSIKAAFAQCQVCCPEFDLRMIVGPPIGSMLRQIALGATEAQLGNLEREFRLVYDSRGWQKTTCYAAAREILQELKEFGKRCFLVTNKPLHITKKILEMVGIDSYFFDLQARDSRVPPFQSKGEILRSLLDRYNLDPATCLAIGDTIDDCLAAEEAGITVALVSHGYGSVQVRKDRTSCFTVNSLEELKSRCGLNGENHDRPGHF
jgi:phosphoglycolate phosphatase